MTNEEYESAVGRADDFLDMLKDTCHDQYDKIKELEKEIKKLTAESTHYESKYYKEAKKVDNAIEYIDHLKANAPDEIALDKILKILEGENNE